MTFSRSSRTMATGLRIDNVYAFYQHGRLCRLRFYKVAQIKVKRVATAGRALKKRVTSAYGSL